jgi:hypothetical protein
MADNDDRVELTDLDVIARYSLAVRAATAGRADLIATLRSDLTWLESGRSRRTSTAAAPSPVRPAPAPADAPPRPAPTDKRAPAVKKAASKKAAAVAKRAPGRKATAAKKTPARKAAAKKTASKTTGRRR